MSKINQTQFAILGHLSLQPLSGYGIKKMIAESTENFWSESYGNLYPCLQKLLKEGLIQIANSNTKIGKRQQVEYKITPAGLDYLIVWLNHPHTAGIVRDELLLKIFFGKHAEQAELLSHLTIETQRLKQSIKLLTTLKVELPKKHVKNPHLPYWLMTINCGLKEMTARFNWCGETIKELQALR